MASSATSRSPSSRIRVARLRPRILAIKGVEQFAYLLGGTLGHDDDLSKPATPKQFGKRRIDAKCPSRDSEIWVTFCAFIERTLMCGHVKKLRGDGCRTNNGV